MGFKKQQDKPLKESMQKFSYWWYKVRNIWLLGIYIFCDLQFEKKPTQNNPHNSAGSVNANIPDMEHSRWQSHHSVQARNMNTVFSICLELLQE